MKSRILNGNLDYVKNALAIKHWNYSFAPNDWFRPDDVSPHDKHFKYICCKLHRFGLLERSDTCGRWGYRYRIPIRVESQIKTDTEKKK
jgi:hypothetical protein